MLAQRTQKLIEELKPDTVLVQASPKWWSNARMLKFVDSQDEMNVYSPELDRHANLESFDYYRSNRQWSALIRLGIYNWLFRTHFGFRDDFAPMRPGLEVKFACEAAEKVGSNIEFMGVELNQPTWQRLLHETRFNAPQYFMKKFQYADSRWTDETQSCRQKIAMVGAQAFTEKVLDTNMMNWFIQSADVFFPNVKKIMVDERDEELFTQIDNAKGDKIVVVVN